MNSGILKYVRAEKYGFEIGDLLVAALVKAYLQEIDPDTAAEKLSRIVFCDVLELTGGTVKSRELPKEKWFRLNETKLAELIDSAKSQAGWEVRQWKAKKNERVLDATINYIRDELYSNVDGIKYVETMPIEMAEFITDCWLAVSRKWVAEHGFSTSDQRQILIGQLGLPTQLSNALQRGGLNSVADILAFENKESLLAIRNLGDQRYEELIRELETRGYDVSHLK